MTKWWMIRAGDNNELIPVWKEKGIASIGWPKLGNPKHYLSKEDMLIMKHVDGSRASHQNNS